MHWLGYNDAVSSLNEAKTPIFQPTANFEKFEIRLYFVSLPAVRPGCARCRAPEISHDKGNGGGFYGNVVLKTIYPLRHGDFLYPSFSFLNYYTIYTNKTTIIHKLTLQKLNKCTYTKQKVQEQNYYKTFES